MTPHQIELVQASFGDIASLSDIAADAFYAELFRISPATREMFPADMAQQKRKLMMAIGFAVSSLKSPNQLVPQLRKLGLRHATVYGVLPHHYDIVGEALLNTLATALGDQWTGDLREAWATAYREIADHMMAGAESLRWIA